MTAADAPIEDGNGNCDLGSVVDMAGTPRRGRFVSDALLSGAALVLLLLVVVASDARVRSEIAMRFGSPSRASNEIVSVGARAQNLATVVVRVAVEQSQQHTPMVIFLAAATMLTVFMIRS